MRFWERSLDSKNRYLFKKCLSSLPSVWHNSQTLKREPGQVFQRNKMNRRSEWNIDWKVAGWLFAGCGLLAGCGSAGNESGGGTSVFFAATVAGITFLASFVGGAVPMCFQVDRCRRLLETLTSVSAGFLVAAACLIVIPEGFERFSHEASPSATETPHEHEDRNHAHSHSPDQTGGFLNSPTLAGLAILAGFLMMLVTESLGFGHDIHEEHHNHSGGHVHHPAASEGKRLATTVVIGLTIHTIADGMAIGASLATGSHVLTGSLVMTLLTHKVPAAFSLSLFSQHAHGNRRRTWIDLVVFSLATPLAILGTWAILGKLSDQVLGIVLLFSAGTFIYVATIDVLPNVLQTNKRRAAASYVSFGCLALLILIVLLNILGFSLHEHG